ncbi:hypothetical protein [Solidesulfovibrio magneticus]|uniref:Uncharacterized protein n=1 Tax=Solidesulfovibrio magneticus (strain ATCC 700980 / DSM 13731 / RS-1) TaxID=573370 RepID=C4XRZ4_SOLM1|nr:hypothetical protein [Solidesulfovibrio magneticus]BAH78060.1 hypothetical protein DMR_45690 [Solidesulfovibrio magneticus RS-1]
MSKKQGIAVGVIVFLAIAYFGLTQYASHVAKTRLEAAIAKKGPFVQILYGNVSYNIFTQNTVIRAVSFKGPKMAAPIFAKEIIVRRLEMDSPKPTSVSMDILGIELEPSALGREAAAELAALGYAGPWSCDVTVDMDSLVEKRELKSHMVYAAKNVGSLRLDFVLGNLDFAAAKPEAVMAGLFNCALKQAEMAYTDASLVERIFKQNAAKQGLDLPAYKKQLADQLDTSLQRSSKPLPQAFINALKQFVENPRQLTISANPTAPVSFMELLKAGTPEAVANLLALDIKS